MVKNTSEITPMIGHGCNEETFEFKYFSILPRRIEAELNFFCVIAAKWFKRAIDMPIIN